MEAAWTRSISIHPFKQFPELCKQPSVDSPSLLPNLFAGTEVLWLNGRDVWWGAAPHRSPGRRSAVGAGVGFDWV